MRHIILVGFSLLFFTTGMALGQTQISITTVNSPAGSTVILPILVQGGGNISAIQFMVNVPDGSLSIPEGGVTGGEALADHSAGSSVDGGSLTVVIFSSSLSTLKMADGVLIAIEFAVAEDAAGFQAVTLSEIQTSDVDGQTVAVGSSDGGVDISGQANMPEAGENELIHVAHEVSIGKRTRIASHAMIAGSAQIGDDVWIGPMATVSSSVRVGDGAHISLGDVVTLDLDSGMRTLGKTRLPKEKLQSFLKSTS